MIIDKIIRNSTSELRKAGITTADIDVRAILKFALEQDDVFLFTHNLDLMTNAQYQKFRRLIRRRKKGEPVAYLTGHKEFYSLDFIVNKHVLIPRPETEALVDNALHFLGQREKDKAKGKAEISIIDIGTGSGCIIISMAKNLSPETYHLKPSLFATDVSDKALKIAKKNAKKHGADIHFYNSDLLSNKRLPKTFDLIIANLPYLTEGKKGIKYRSPGKIGLNFEPKEALYTTDSGFQLIEKLVNNLPSRLNPGGSCLLEVDESHTPRLIKLCKMLYLKLSNISDTSSYGGFWSIRNLADDS